MTIIDDDTTREAGNQATDRIDEAAARTEDAARRIAAAVAGALEGFVDALDEYDLANAAKDAIQEAGEISRAAAVEGKAQAQTPEMQQAGAAIKRGATRTADATRAAAENVRETVADARETVRETVDSVRETAQHAKEEVKVRAQAVAETGRRAKAAPRNIGYEIGAWWAAWKRGVATSIVASLVIALFGLTSFIVLTIALVVGFDRLIGDPAGTFLVFGIYVVIAGIAWGSGRAMRARAALEREERVENAKEEVRHVVRPVREAFGRGRTNI